MDDLDALLGDLEDSIAPPAPVAEENLASALDDLLDELSVEPEAAPQQIEAEVIPGLDDLASFVPPASFPAAPQLTSNLPDTPVVPTPVAAPPQTVVPPPAAEPKKEAAEEDLDDVALIQAILNGTAAPVPESEVAPVVPGALVCGKCSKAITGPMLTAVAKSWHPDCFECQTCSTNIADQTFFEDEGEAFCETCYNAKFAPTCPWCNEKVLGDSINALNSTWHPECFRCCKCGKDFPGGSFLERDGSPYCDVCFNSCYADRCGKCDAPVVGDCVEALGKTWHPDHFCCLTCEKPFHGAPYFEHKGEPYCEQHYHAALGTLCGACGQAISGRCMTALGRKWHPECLHCSFCRKPLVRVSFKTQQQKPYCAACHAKLFG